MDSTPHLIDLYDRYKDSGLKIIGRAYEFSRDDAHNKKQVARFVKTYGVTWPIEIVPGTMEEFEKITPPELTVIDSLPVLVFLDRKHKVRLIQAGFAGRATGPDYDAQRARHEALIKEMLAGAP